MKIDLSLRAGISQNSLLPDFKKKFDAELQDFLEQKIKKSRQLNFNLEEVLKEIQKMVSVGGKRTRPVFMFLAYRACGGKNNKAITEACCAIELLHHFALIHDDIMDNAPLRRGRPTLHQVLGVPSAILAGDLLQNYAWEILANSSFPPVVLQKAQKLFAQISEEMVAGQYLDMHLSRSRTKIVNFEKEKLKILRMLELKSGKYSVERPCHLGAVLAGASRQKLQTLSNYGLPLGLAFQIEDDILGMFGERKALGKSVDSDLKEGKVTLLVVKTLEHLAKMDGKIENKFLSIWGNQKATPQDLEWVRELIKETGSFEYSQNLAYKLTSQAKQAMSKSSFSQKTKEPFLEIADFLINREN